MISNVNFRLKLGLISKDDAKIFKAKIRTMSHNIAKHEKLIDDGSTEYHKSLDAIKAEYWGLGQKGIIKDPDDGKDGEIFYH
jgi:hypothetical protein